MLYYIFTDKIGKLSGEGELLPHHEYSITKKNFVFLMILILIMKLEEKFIQIIKLF